MAKRTGAKVKEAEIEAKDQRWHCRNRVTLVFGSNDIEELDTYVYTKDSLEFKTVKFHHEVHGDLEEGVELILDSIAHYPTRYLFKDENGKVWTLPIHSVEINLSLFLLNIYNLQH